MKRLKQYTIFLIYSLLLITLIACQTTTPQSVPAASPAPIATSASASLRLPTLEEWEYSCSGGTLTFTVKWIDKATNETGYRIFRNGEKVVELPPNSTTYTDTLSPYAGESVEYSLQVFDPGGTADKTIAAVNC